MILTLPAPVPAALWDADDRYGLALRTIYTIAEAMGRNA
jgi:hypothetical protein